MGGGSFANSVKIANSTNTSYKLPKIAFSLALIFGGVNLAFAEESGGFVGFGIGGGGTQYNVELTNIDGTEEGGKENLGGINYGFVAGYKQFFTPYLGLRYYVNLDLHHNLKDFTGTSYRPDITLINYGANVDFLGNFVSSESMDFGGFVGVGIGANSITGKFIKDDVKVYEGDGWKFTDIGFDIWLNVGLRANIATNHGLEVVAKVPFLPVKMLDFKITAGGSYKFTFKQDYSIMARYAFSF